METVTQQMNIEIRVLGLGHAALTESSSFLTCPLTFRLIMCRVIVNTH